MAIDLNVIVPRIKNILMEPSQEWDAIKREELTVKEVYMRYLVGAAAIPALAHFVGLVVSMYSALPMSQMSIGISKAVAVIALYYVLWLGSAYATAFFINQMARIFQSSTDFPSALKLAGFSWVAVWAVGLLLVVPMLRQLLLLALFYGIYILHLGLPKLLNTPPDKVIPFTAVIGVVMFLLFIITGWYCSSL